MPAIVIALTALVLYAATLARFAFPGESARLVVERLGLDAPGFPLHPVWCAASGAFARATGVSSAFGMNAFSLVCGVLAAGLLALLMGRFVRGLAVSEETAPHARTAGMLAAIASGVSFVFAAAPWAASTHLDPRIFDVLWALLAFALLALSRRFPRAAWAWALAAGAVTGAGLAEAAAFVALLPLLLLALLVRGKKGRGGLLLPFLLGAAAGGVAVVNWAAGAAGDGTAFTGAAVRLVTASVAEMRTWFGREGWLAVQALAVLPFAACAFIARRALNGERRRAQHFFHLAMTVCATCALATPLAPAEVLRRYGVNPVAATALVAAVAGYLVAYWWILASAKPVAGDDDAPGEDRAACAGRRLAPVAGGAFAFVVALSAAVNALTHDGRRGDFADVCARETLKRLGERSWFVTDGLLDDNLRLAAAAEGRKLTLVCLQRDLDDAYLKRLAADAAALREDCPGADLEGAACLGVLPFLREWFAHDAKIASRAAVWGLADVWGLAGARPLPSALLFVGAADTNGLDGAALKRDFDAFWDAHAETLRPVRRGAGSLSIPLCPDPVEQHKLALRRHVGMVANNLGVLLLDLGCVDAAYAIFERVLKEIDPDNPCALFNEFEMASAGAPAARARAKEIEKQLKKIVDDPKRRYPLRGLARFYGYVRNPGIFARLGYAWAQSGQMGSALAQVQRAIDALPSSRQPPMLNLLAAVYASGGETARSRATYEQAVAAGGETAQAAYRGLARLALQEGDLDGARKMLGNAKKDGAEIETGLLALAEGRSADAAAAFRRAADADPNSLQAWSLYASALLQRLEGEKEPAVRAKTMAEVESVALPRLEKLAADPRDYYLQLTRGLVWMHKGRAFRKDARDALALALQARPDVATTGNLVLELDVQLNDEDAALRHARTVLRRDRRNTLANWVMGSVRLRRGDFLDAERLLRASCAENDPPPAALNDLAEALRRVGKSAEAETWARKATAAQPDLYVTWETLGSALLDQKKDLDEAERCVRRAVELAEKSGDDDPRMQLTLARVLLAKGDKAAAAKVLRAIMREASKFANWDRNQYESLLREAKAR